jgi:formamidopyrimidine-DNA glycosylase
MPELPEVETIARKLEPDLLGKTIKEATALPDIQMVNCCD